MEVPPARWTNATRQILVLGRQAPRKFSHPAKKRNLFSLFLLDTHGFFYLLSFRFLSSSFIFTSLDLIPSHPTPYTDSRKGERSQGRPWKDICKVLIENRVWREDTSFFFVHILCIDVHFIYIHIYVIRYYNIYIIFLIVHFL